MKRNHEIPVNLNLLPKGQMNKTFQYFFEYFLDHACVCSNQDCICRASTFMDLICEPELRRNEEYSRTIEEILRRV
jgi:hypothetical protein